MEDLRIIKTKSAIKQAFFSLVDEVGFDNVKVSDIAKRAQMNRNTFYLHYESKEDLVQKLANESLTNRFNNVDFEKTFKSRSKRAVNSLFTNFMDDIEENIDVYRIYLTNPAMAGYLSIATNRLKELVFGFIKKTPTTKLQIEYLFSGIIGIVSKWIVLAIGTKEEVTKVLTEMTFVSGKQIYMNMR